MKRSLTMLAAALLLATPAVAGGFLTLEDAWARPNLPNRPAAAYVTIRNTGDADDALIAVSSAAFGRAELHTVVKDGDVMRMAPLDRLPVPAGGTARLKPGHHHAMLFEATEPLKVGATFPLTLTFETAGEVTTEVSVRRRAPEEKGHSGHDME